jgi:uncharacterized membrane protein YgcG
VAEIRRDEQKLWLILFQIRGVRVRLNSLALQRWIFSTLALLVSSAGLIFAAALMLGPLWFLSMAAVIVLFALAAMLREGRAALRQHANPVKAATIADERGALKGRLTTVMTLAQTPRLSPLWAYLVEDTYSLRDDFEPARIEPRFISRSIFALLAACLIAMLLVPFAVLRRGGSRQAAAAHGEPGEITADLGNLEIRPADPALEPNAQVYADPETLRKLGDKLAAAQDQDNDKSPLGRWMSKARNLAADLQDQLTGQKPTKDPPLRLKLTDRNPGADSHGASKGHGQPGQGHDNSGQTAANSKGSGGNPAGDARQSQPPVASRPGQQADPLAQNQGGLPQTPGSNSAHSGESDLQSLFDNNGAGLGGGGSSHGSGSDPRNLFGPASSQPLGNDNFKITIEAQPSDESSTPGPPAYIPPKVRVPLNSNQYPDEPLARTAVPAADQMMVKRVFER